MASSSKTRLDAIERTYRELFNTTSSLSRIRDAALADRLFNPKLDGLDLPGRSIAWKLFMIPTEPLKTPVETDPSLLLEALQCSRQQYSKLLLEKMRAPDGGYEEGFTLPGSTETPKRVRPDINLQRNNPLSLDTENPWREWFASVELRKTILQDVERTFPEVDFFRLPEIQAQLTSILFIYSVINPSIGYRQGMHELLAPVYHAVYYDALAEGEVKDTVLQELCSKSWIAADAWTLFDSIMTSAGRWYEWQEPTISVPDRSPLNAHFHLHVTEGEGRVELKPYITPIVHTCNDIQANFLRKTDPQLWQRLQATGIEPQIYGIRWLRLLFTREFSLPDAMKLWDALFACDMSLDLAPWICVAMLIRIRNELLPADYTGQLTVLLRYPSPQRSLDYDIGVKHTSLLVRQALALQMSPTPATGVSLMNENWNLLNIPMDVPEAPAPLSHRQAARNRPPSASTSTVPPPYTTGHSRQPSSQQVGFSEMLGGILERGESLGINKSLMNAVNELKRNIPDIASSLMKSPNSVTSFPLTNEVEGERPPWEPRSRLDMEREIAQYRSVNKRLGDSLTWIVDVLLQDEDETSKLDVLRKKRKEAVESLAYVRDVLISDAKDVEEERLYGEEELSQRLLKAKMKERRNEPDIVTPNIPSPTSTVDSRQRTSPATVGPSRRTPRSLDISGISTISHAPTTLPTDNASRPTAPWNYTRSNFASPSISETALPRPPPPSSTAVRRPAPTMNSKPVERSSAPVLRDPLGAIH